MLKEKLIKTLAAFALSFCALSLDAQDAAYNFYTPYSMFGIGDISKQGTAYNKTMGGVGIATRDKRNINILNPAAVTEREDKSFMADFGLAQSNKYYAQSDGSKSANNTMNVYNFVISFPIYKSLAMYGGITPYSDVGYDMSSKITDPAIISKTGVINNTLEGYGGMSEIFLGAGVDLTKWLSVGAEVQYYFGNLHRENIYNVTSSSYRDIYSGYDINLHTATAKLGAQAEIPLSTTLSAVVGATYRLGSNFKGEIQRYEIQSISSVNDSTPSPRTYIDTLGSGRAKLASEIGVGFALRGGDKWMLELDYVRSDWSNSGLAAIPGFAVVGSTVFAASTSQSVRAGFSIVPNRNDIRYYRRRITYRAGAYWDQAYCTVDGNKINAVGLTLGVTLPVFRWSNGLTLGVEAGQRGTTANNLVRERYVNFSIGMNIFDIWFIKPRYE